MKTNQALLNDINACQLAAGEMALWWLGQFSFIVKTNHHTLYFDPYLSASNSRLVPPLLNPQEITNADFILCSHDHSDHTDYPSLAAILKASTKAKLVVPELLLDKVSRQLSIDNKRLIGMDEGKSFQVPSLELRAVPSAHEFLDEDSVTGSFPYLGYVVVTDGLTLYHSGDCCIYEGLVSKLKAWKPNIMLLPINGRDAQRYARNCMGNMTFQEAADLAGAVGPQWVIPAHYDMFQDNSEDPQKFLDYVAIKHIHIRAVKMDYGTCLKLKKEQS